MLERESVRPVFAGGSVVRERRKGARLLRGRRGQVRRQVAGGRGRAREDTEQRRPACGKPACHALAHRVQVGGGRLQHVHAAETHRRRGKAGAPHAEGEVTGADRCLLEELGLLHQHLHRQTGGEHLDQARVLRRVVALRRDADEIVREQREVVRRERVLVITLEERVVIGLDVRAVGLELGNGDCLDDFDEPRQARAVRVRGGRAVVEREFEGRAGAGAGRMRVERLCAKNFERPFDALPARRRELVAGRAAHHEL